MSARNIVCISPRIGRHLILSSNGNTAICVDNNGQFLISNCRMICGPYERTQVAYLSVLATHLRTVAPDFVEIQNEGNVVIRRMGKNKVFSVILWRFDERVVVMNGVVTPYPRIIVMNDDETCECIDEFALVAIIGDIDITPLLVEIKNKLKYGEMIFDMDD
jgi:hypothetical protein